MQIAAYFRSPSTTEIHRTNHVHESCDTNHYDFSGIFFAFVLNIAYNFVISQIYVTYYLSLTFLLFVDNSLYLTYF